MIISVHKDIRTQEIFVKIKAENNKGSYVICKSKEITDKLGCFSFQFSDEAMKELMAKVAEDDKLVE